LPVDHSTINLWVVYYTLKLEEQFRTKHKNEKQRNLLYVIIIDTMYYSIIKGLSEWETS